MANALNINLTDKFVTIEGEPGIFLVTGGFGASSHTSGNAVFVTEQGTGLRLRFEGYEVTGMVEDPNLPLVEIDFLLAETSRDYLRAKEAWEAAAVSFAESVLFNLTNKKRNRQEAATAYNMMSRALNRHRAANWRAADEQQGVADHA